MIDEPTLVDLLDQLDRLERENAELRAQVDWLLRERMDVESLKVEAKKPLGAKVALTVLPQGDEG